MSLIKCPKCQNSVSNTVAFCPQCGNSIHDNSKAAINTASQNSQIPKKQNNGCAIVLIIFFGILFIGFLSRQCSKTETDTEKNYTTGLDIKLSKEDSIKNKAKSDSIDKQQKIEEEKFSKTKAGKIHKKHPEWSKEDCINISENRIWIGMHYDMLVYQRGRPDNVNTSNYGNGPQYQACWHDYDASCFYFDASQIITSYN
ncbi:zinc-ribbon domain-containing protein [Chryseobacterium oleae]|uniref:Zinc-ribbon domain-containing protein n=1 Tax=Chryseobacterium oleae TaxID=491207 RepID=A0A1I4XBN6_CHROL|nr:zinc-ribbon domain-containing protein [Chryseobacterium oleae]SFN22730.1 zinc-ribbon domain-containing protein [Chryseobacterium oleae]